VKYAFVVFVPTYPGTGAKGLGNPGNCGQRAESQLKGSGNVSGTVFVRERERLFFG